MAIITKEFMLTCDHEDCASGNPFDGITVDAWHCGNAMETSTCYSYSSKDSIEIRSRHLQEHLDTMDLRGGRGYREYLCFWTIKKNGKVLCPKHATIDHVLENSKKMVINGAVSYRFGNFYYFHSHGSWHGEEYDLHNDDTTTNPVGIDPCFRKEDLLAQIANKQKYIEQLHFSIEVGGCWEPENINDISYEEWNKGITNMTINKSIDALDAYYEGHGWHDLFKDDFGNKFGMIDSSIRHY